MWDIRWIDGSLQYLFKRFEWGITRKLLTSFLQNIWQKLAPQFVRSSHDDGQKRVAQHCPLSTFFTRLE